jgi:hypothetical protein
LEVFCEEFGISSPLQDLEKRNGELEIALKELTELKESQNKEEKDPAPPAKKSKRKRGAARTKSLCLRSGLALEIERYCIGVVRILPLMWGSGYL